jgi:hypothetical protein
MLSPETPFPYPGSYALHIDADRPAAQQSAELVRILWRTGAHTGIAYPLREGASGNRIVEHKELINATPLDQYERRELAELYRELHGRVIRSVRMREKAERLELLRSRATWAVHLARLLRRMYERTAARLAA